jgi:nicotinic acid mononucleotide adenylyltransferase
MSKKDLTKDERIKKEINRLKRLYKEMPKDMMNKVISLIENAAFMTITLEDLQEKINKDGTVSEYQNGENQWGTKKSPEVEIYNTMIKNHMGIIKQLTDLMPQKPQPNKNADDFIKILKRE